MNIRPSQHSHPLSKEFARRIGVLVFALLSLFGTVPDIAGAAELRPLDYAQIAGWNDDRHAVVLSTFARSCIRMINSNRAARIVGRKVAATTVRTVCRRATGLAGTADNLAARKFFERYFAPFRVVSTPGDNGLFTGYFEPEFTGSKTPTVTHHVPLYRTPSDFAAASKPYLSRRRIEQGALDGRGLELVYLASAVDAFFVHVQGSARIKLTDGTVMRVGFAAKNGHPYTAIGKVLIDRGALRRKDVSMQTIRTWLEQSPAEAQEVMWRNRSFIFFRESDPGNPKLGPKGAQGVNLDALRSLAVDNSLYSYGIPMWLETTLPLSASEPAQPFQRLMVAQDTGSAIKGAIRADVFVGTGQAAGEIAGRMKQNGRLVVLVPRSDPAAGRTEVNGLRPAPAASTLK